ncbi:hypothetical protein PARU111607_15815 [Palleronia rufa]
MHRTARGRACRAPGTAAMPDDPRDNSAIRRDRTGSACRSRHAAARGSAFSWFFMTPTKRQTRSVACQPAFHSVCRGRGKNGCFGRWGDEFSTKSRRRRQDRQARPQRLTLPCRNFHAGGSRSRLFGQDVAAKRVRTHVARSGSSTHRRQARRRPVHPNLSPLQATSGRPPGRKTRIETVHLILRVRQRHGIFDRLYTDNRSAVAGHPVAGGNVHRFRNAGRQAGRETKRVQPLDREIVFRRAVVDAGIGHPRHDAVQRRFAAGKTPNPVEMLTDDGAPDSARDTRILGRQIGPKTLLHAGEGPAEQRDSRSIRDDARARLPPHHAAARRSDRPRIDRRVVQRRQRNPPTLNRASRSGIRCRRKADRQIVRRALFGAESENRGLISSDTSSGHRAEQAREPPELPKSPQRDST